MKLYALAYASRLYRVPSSDGKVDSAYTTMRKALGANPDLSSDQPDALMTFLNEWKCHIPKAKFEKLGSSLQKWSEEWIKHLPAAGRDICSLTLDERSHVGAAYVALLESRKAFNFRHTAASKTLHCLRPDALPMWDKAMRSKLFNKEQPPNEKAGQLYAEFIRKVAGEICELEQDVERLKRSGRDDDLQLDECRCGLVKLVDEYYYVTITLGHAIPSSAELEKWLIWSR